MLEASAPGAPTARWHRELNGYHWFVLIVCTLGWLFDCLDQQLFNGTRTPAMSELLRVPASDPQVGLYAGYSTSLLLIGWATGGIIFGIMGDRLGRARTMVFTILFYSVFTGLSAFSVGVWDFILYRFLTGLGVGGQFSVGVSLVAEALPDRARTPALGMLQALSAVGNVTAALIVMLFEHLAAIGTLPHSAWRWIFGVGILPALLAVLVMRRLKEPEKWQKAVAEGKARGEKKAGAVTELFSNPRWRRNTIGGMILGAAGVIGLWAIGVFSNDLAHSIFSKRFQNEARSDAEVAADRQFVAGVIAAPGKLADYRKSVSYPAILDADEHRDGRLLYAAALTLADAGQTPTREAVLSLLDAPATVDGTAPLDKANPRRPAQTAAERQRRQAYLDIAAPEEKLPAHADRVTAERDASILSAPEGEPASHADRIAQRQKKIEGELASHADRIAQRQKKIEGRVGFWRSINLMFFNIGAFFGIYSFSVVTQRIGRRPSFAFFFLAAMVSTALAFLWMNEVWHLFVMTPLMGFFQLSVFGGYAIYFPELFPTRLRSTGTSFCYNIARYVAALGPTATGLLTNHVFGHHPEPMRYAGATMCGIFLLGVIVLPMMPETKGKPLPE